MCIIKPEEEVVQLKEKKGKRDRDTAHDDSEVQGGG
jgi:hypothetical protein